MKISVKTMELKKMVTRAAKGASNDKMLPLTSMLCIEKTKEGTGGILNLITTNGKDTTFVIGNMIPGGDFLCVVPVDLFSKLVTKLTCEKVSLEVTEGILTVSGNGTYKIPIPMDTDGPVIFPKPSTETDSEPINVKMSTIRSIIATNKPSLSTSVEDDCLCAYHVHDAVVTTNEDVICVNETSVTPDPVLISREMMDIISIADADDVNIYINGSVIVMDAGTMLVHGPAHSGIEEFPIEDIKDYANTEFPSSCAVSKAAVKNLMDRLALFIEPYDRNGAYFTFTKDSLQISSKRSSICENIEYKSSKGFKEFSCCVDVPTFKAMTDCIPGDLIEIHYGDASADQPTLKISGSGVSIIMCLMNDDMGV